ncbi:intermembrane transport protein PqiB [Pseudoalteromonas sp. XMcav1-K]|uniref:intermembrane transport protein PqiB n=1 Tax=Pseudoalteromonas sp. XMcav1-K TaxID=3374372 RepID=UPI00375802C7
MSPTAAISKKRTLSPIWIIPLIAVFVASWMFYQYQQSQGTTIYITMPNAEGVIPGKTEIKVRSVKMGVIAQVRLAEDQTTVVARAVIDKDYEHLLNQDAKIWIVKTRIDETGISGLNTLLSGVYFEFLPGESDARTRQFTLLDTPPQIPDNIKGQRYLLTSKNTNVIDVGTTIYYNGYSVGQVETAKFDWQQQIMRYGIFIRSPYENLVTENVVFWVNSAIEVDLSADGINFKTSSLAKMLKGGISFAIPEGEKPDALAKQNQTFRLNSDYQKALEHRYDEYDYYVIQFEQSIRGLTPGAPVEYRGIRIGTVEEAPAMLVIDNRPAHFSTDSTAVPVKIKIEYKRIFHDTKIAKEFWQNSLDGWIEKGLRASLKTGNLLTGSIYIDFDLYQDVKPFQQSEFAGLKVFPSTSSGFSVMANQVSELLAKFNNLDMQTPLNSFDKTMNEYNTFAVELRELLNRKDTQSLPNEFNETLAQVEKSMATFDETMLQFEKTMSDYEKGSAIYHELNSTLDQLKQLAEQLQPLSKGLNEQPNMFIFDKQLATDPTPRKQ